MIDADTKGPFLPFKGKGGARIRLRELERCRTAIEQAMRALVQTFQSTFRPPRIAHLAVHHQGGYFHLRWRAAASGGTAQTYLELATSEPGQRLWSELPPAARPLYLNLERQRLELNLASSLCQHELRRLRDYLSKLEALRGLERENAS